MGKTGVRSRGASFLLLGLLFLVLLAPQASLPQEDIKEVALDFDDVDIRLFIRVISELTGRNFIIDNNVRGKVTVLSPKKLTTRQAYEAFKSVLAVNGFAVVEAGEVTKIVPAQNMSGYELPVRTQKVREGEDQFITQVMPLTYLDAKGLLPLLKPLMSRQATIFATPSADVLVATDYKGNIEKLEKLLDEIDVEMLDETIERLELSYSSATVVSAKITEILDAKYGKARKGARAVFFKIVPLERINALIALAAPVVMSQIKDILAKMDHPTPEGKSLLNVYYLEHAKAEDLVLILTQAQEAIASATQSQTAGATPQKTEAGGVVVGGTFKAMGKEISITADKSTNSLVIYAKPDDFNALKGMIQKLDIPRKQVFIESLIIEVDPEETFAFGTEWQAFKDVSPSTGIFGASKTSPSGLDALPPAAPLGEGFSLGVLTEGISVAGFTFPSLSVLVRALESLQSVSILSRPQLLTLNNETAVINVSQNRPFETSTTATTTVGVTQSIEYRDVGIILEITPHINKGGKVRLETNLSESKLAGVAAQINPSQPVTLKRAIDTVVEVQDGGTVVIGGLIEKQTDYTRTQVPCFGSIPFMGWGFKSASMTETQTNLIIFISPRVFDRPQDAEPLSTEKKEYIEDKMKRENEERLHDLPFFKKDKERIRKRQEDYFGE